MLKKIFFTCLVLSSFGFSQTSLRLFPHVPPPRTLFDTWVYISNSHDISQEFQLLGFKANGEVLPKRSEQLIAGQTLRLKSTDLFAGNPAPSHFFVRGEVDVTLEYGSPFSDDLELFVPEQSRPGDAFRLFCQDWQEEFVGLVVVNLGDEPAEIELDLVNFSGDGLDQASLIHPVPVLGKAIFTLEQLFPNGMPVDQCSFVLNASEPVVIQLFKGKVPVRNGDSLNVIMPTIISSRDAVADPWQDQQ